MSEYMRPRNTRSIKKEEVDPVKQEKINNIKFLDRKGRYENAIACLDEYLYEYPMDAYMRTYKAMILSKLRRYFEAREILEDVLENYNLSQRERIFAMNRYARILIANEEIETAIYYYEKIIEESSELELKSRFQLSKLYQFLENKKDALKVLEVKDFNNRYLNVKRAYIYLQFEEYANALLSLERKEKNVSNYEIKESIDDKYISQEENYIKGHIYFKRGQLNRALPYLKNALIIRGRMYYTNAYLDIACIHIMRYEIEEAVNICEELLKTTKSNDAIVKINHVLSKALIKKQDYDKVKEHLNKEVFDDKMTMIKLGKVELLKGNFEKAEEYLKVVDIENDNVNYYFEGFYLKALVKFRLKKYDETLYILDLIEKNSERMELKEMTYEFERMRLCISKSQNKMIDIDIDTNSYSQRQIASYSKQDALRHIISHHCGENSISKFQSEEQVRQIFDSIGDLLTSENVIYDSSYDKYIIKYSYVGSCKDNANIHQLSVITLPGTKDIITMYPLNGNESNIIVEEHDQPKKNKVKRLSQIEKFNKRYNNG